MAQQESVRAVDLPVLPELSESEVGPLLQEIGSPPLDRSCVT